MNVLHWRAYATLLAVAAAAAGLYAWGASERVQVGLLTEQLKGAQTQLATSQTNLGVCQANGVTLRAAVESQNGAVDKLQADGTALNAAAAAAVQASQATAAFKLAQAAQVLAAKPGGKDLCAAADKLILEHVR